MADVVDLVKRAAQDEKYAAHLAATLDKLEQAGDALLDDLVKLAMLGPWREWNEVQPNGTVTQVGTRALAQTNDPRIRALAELLDHAGVVLQELRRGLREQP